MTSVLGAEREETLLSASNMVCSFWQCGQKTEGEWLLRETLALPRRSDSRVYAECAS